MADSLEILSYNMKILRKMRGYSQEKLSEYSGVSEREISKIERRVVNLSFQMPDGIAKGLNVKPADLLTNRFDPRKVFLVENNVQKTLEEEIRRLSEREQELVLECIHCYKQVIKNSMPNGVQEKIRIPEA